MKEMIKKLQKKSNKKGFTLVEIIVVLVILAILAAIAVPAVLGYVDDAKKSKYVQEARAAYTVIQTEEAKYRAKNGLDAKDKIPYFRPDKPGGAALPGTMNILLLQDTIAKEAKLGAVAVFVELVELKNTKYTKYKLVWNSSDTKRVTAKLTPNEGVKIISITNIPTK